MDRRISNFMQVASLRRYVISDGRAKGLEVIDCDNGKIRFLLNVSKALDIMQVYHEGQNVSFLSKNAFISQNMPFINRFEGGMLYTCGLDSIGDRKGFDLHGTLHNLPAEIVYTQCGEDGITVEAIIRDSALFGKNLVLKRKIFSKIGEDSVTVEDTLTNEGFEQENYCVLYHVNVGYPLLDEGGIVEAKIEKATPRNDWAFEKKEQMLLMEKPIDGQAETCYFLRLKEPKVAYINKKLGKRFVLEYSGDTLPCFVEWKSMASGDYALGLEPCTAELDDEFEYKMLGAKQSVSFKLKFSIIKE